MLPARWPHHNADPPHTAKDWEGIPDFGLSQPVDAVVERFGRIDILVNSTGTSIREPLANLSNEEWKRMLGETFSTECRGSIKRASKVLS